MDQFKNRIVVGLTEKVTVISPRGKKLTVVARIDTGAVKSSIDTSLAAKMHLGPVVKTKLVKSASGSSVRPVIVAALELKGKRLTSNFSLAVRQHMKYKVLVGQDILKHGFLVDPMKK